MAGLTNGEAHRLTGTLYVVATPIGNLGDATARSIETLRGADVIACEDTRTSRTLLSHYGIRGRTVALHEHNERGAAKSLIQALREGKNVALVTDAGTPALADPGAWLVAEAHAAGIRVSPLPGANAAATAVSAAGFVASRFLFAGFLPAQASARRKALEALDLPWPVVMYEAPHRVRETLAALAAQFGAEREIVIARELSKKFEEVSRMPLGAALGWLDARREREQGEFVLVLGPGEPRPAASVDAERMLDVLLEVLPPSEAAKLTARITGQPKGALYKKAVGRAK
jgi:16S rRNA (cytidine1402-2'-O)-methyltransferase